MVLDIAKSVEHVHLYNDGTFRNQICLQSIAGQTTEKREIETNGVLFTHVALLFSSVENWRSRSVRIFPASFYSEISGGILQNWPALLFLFQNF